MQTTIADLYEPGGKFAEITAYFPGGGHVTVDGRLRRMPSTDRDTANYWVGRMCLNSDTVLSLSRDFGGQS